MVFCYSSQSCQETEYFPYSKWHYHALSFLSQSLESSLNLPSYLKSNRLSNLLVPTSKYIQNPTNLDLLHCYQSPSNNYIMPCLYYYTMYYLVSLFLLLPHHSLLQQSEDFFQNQVFFLLKTLQWRLNSPGIKSKFQS